MSKRMINITVMVCLLSVLLSGCWIRSTIGNVIYVDSIGEGITEAISTIFASSTASICEISSDHIFNCTYILNGQVITTSAMLYGTFGMTGVLMDPMVLQVPDDTIVVEASYDTGDGSGPQPLVFTQLQSFLATPSSTVQAQPGMKLIMLDFPSDVEAGLPLGNPQTNGTDFDLNLVLKRRLPLGTAHTAQSMKVMFTGKLTINGYTYYPPILPCTTDFASIPAFNIPVAGSQQNMVPSLTAALAGSPIKG